MKNLKKRLGSAILALLLVLSVSGSAFAATGTDASLRLSGAHQSGQITVDVYLTAEDATNGKVEVSYDADQTAFVSAAACVEDWVVSVNAEADGLVSFAWVGTALTEEETCIATLVFNVIDSDTVWAYFSVEATEVYASGSAVGVTGASDEISVQVKKTTPPVIPDSPVVIPPTPDLPVEPEDNEDPIEPEDPEIPECSFTDIEHWAKESILAVYDAGLMNGVSDTSFAPDEKVSRAMVVQVLYRMAGAPAVTGTNNFTDLTDDWYKDAIQWAVDNGITNGRSDTSFAPNADVTREEMATFIYRFAKLSGEDVSASADLTGYEDADSISSWAVTYLSWANAKGLINGRTATTLVPGGTALRGELATILVRYIGL